MVARIRVGFGVYALVDDEDAKRVSRHDWHVKSSAHTSYAFTQSKAVGANQRLLHRYILGLKPGEIGDHVNGNGLDNRRVNLRKVTAAENSRNSFVATREKGKSSQFKGVVRHGNRWIAQIKADGRQRRLGYFDDEQKAARAYDAAAVQHFGEFAKTNEAMGLYADQQPVERNRHVADGPLVHTPAYEPDDDGRLSPEERKRRRMRLKMKNRASPLTRQYLRLMRGMSKKDIHDGVAAR